MRLHLENIAKIAEADVEIEGITVIAGENNTGKSTVGKALFSVFNSFDKITHQIKNDKIYEISRALSSLYDTWEYSVNTKLDAKVNARRIFEAYAKKKFSDSKDDNQFREFISSLVAKEFRVSEDSININRITDRIIDILSIGNTDYMKEILGNRLKSEFNSQINNLFNNTTGVIGLQIDGIKVSANIYNNEITELTNFLTLKNNAIYLDNPFIIDDANSSSIPDSDLRTFDHKTQLLTLLSKRENSAINAIIAKNKLSSVYKKISLLAEGDLIIGPKGGYEQKGTKSTKTLDVRNVSAGLKTFVIIKALLQNGSIEENGTLILDEPEIHLHPAWQVLFAEMIVLLQKEFKLHILLNTHSPYFLRAIEVYSQKHEISNRCKYYLAENIGESAVIRNVSDQTEQIYKLLSAPFQTLENERWSDD